MNKQSQDVIVEAPLSFTGAAKRINKLNNPDQNLPVKILVRSLTIFLVALAWTFIIGWYLLWGLWIVPFRLLRRSSRKQKRDNLRHQEMLNAIQNKQAS